MSNITAIKNIDGIYAAGSFANTATNGAFWGIILVAIFIVLVINLIRNGVDKALISAAFTCLLLSLGMFLLNWVNIYFPVIFTLILAGTGFYIRFKERSAQ